MSLPTKEQVHDDVVLILTVFTGKKTSQIAGADDLQKDLQLRSSRLSALALSLRGYIKQHKSDATLVAKEVRKADTTVAKLVDLVSKRIKGAA